MKVFRERLKKLIKENNITYQKLADEVQTTKVTISRYINGHRTPDIRFLYEVAQYFNVSTDYLLGITEVKNHKLSKGLDDYLEFCQYAKEENIEPNELEEVMDAAKRLKTLFTEGE